MLRDLLASSSPRALPLPERAFAHPCPKDRKSHRAFESWLR